MDVKRAISNARKMSYFGIDNEDRLELLLEVLEDNGIQYEAQISKDNEVTNIILPAKNRDNGIIVVMAHYDVVDYVRTTGYLDNATAIGMIIEMKRKGMFSDDVEVVFDDFEESGFYGCKMYMDKYYREINFVINVDIIGIGDSIYYDNESGQSWVDSDAHSFDAIPFKVPGCDHYPIKRYTEDVVTLCSGNRGDAGVFEETLKNDILPYMHGGDRDIDAGIDDINEEIIEKTAYFIKTLTN